MLYEKHKEKLQFRIGVLVDNPTEIVQPVQIFGYRFREVTNPDVKLMDYYCNHLFDDGNLTFLNNYLQAQPIMVKFTIIKSDNGHQLGETLYFCSYDANGIGAIVPVTPKQDPNQYSDRITMIQYGYRLDFSSEIRFSINAFTSVLIEFIPYYSMKVNNINSLNIDSSIEYSKDKKKYLFIL